MSSDDTPAVSFEIYPPQPPNDGILFVDHSRTGRSGHLGHALVEYAPERILAFYPNCSDANKGHTGDGWMEVKRSEDGNEVILRLYETRGSSRDVVLRSRRAWKSIQEVDLMEENGKSVPRSSGAESDEYRSEAPLRFGPYQIRTFRVKYS